MIRPLRILIADDHPIVRSGLRQVLSEAGAAAVGEAATPQEALDRARREPWDLLILDVRLPGRGGLDVLRELKVELPRLPVLVLSMHSEEQYAVRAFRAGAAGYLTKEAAAERLLDAVNKIAMGGRYVSPELAEQLAATLGPDAPPAAGHEALSDREFEVLRLIASGKTVGEIAEQLALSVKTVSSYRARVLEKTGLRNNAELMRYAIRQRLIDSDE